LELPPNHADARNPSAASVFGIAPIAKISLTVAYWKKYAAMTAFTIAANNLDFDLMLVSLFFNSKFQQTGAAYRRQLALHFCSWFSPGVGPLTRWLGIKWRPSIPQFMVDPAGRRRWVSLDARNGDIR